MKIKSAVYESLTPRQRIIAVIEAQARTDFNEVDTLLDTCPRKTYTGLDAKYLTEMQKLLILSLSVESEMRGYALGAMACYMTDPETAGLLLQKMSDIQAAWNEILSDMGINHDTMQKAMGFENPLVNALKQVLPEPEANAVIMLKDAMA